MANGLGTALRNRLAQVSAKRFWVDGFIPLDPGGVALSFHFPWPRTSPAFAEPADAPWR
jgi:hypothetical protein